MLLPLCWFLPLIGAMCDPRLRNQAHRRRAYPADISKASTLCGVGTSFVALTSADRAVIADYCTFGKNEKW
jgi:hypothetical protein